MFQCSHPPIDTIASLVAPDDALDALVAAGAHRCNDGVWIVPTASGVEQVLNDPGFAVPPPPDDAAGTLQRQMARWSEGPAHRARRAVADDALATVTPAALRLAAREAATAALAQLRPAAHEAASRAQAAARSATATPPDGPSFDVMPLARRIPVEALATGLGLDDPVAAVAATAALCRAVSPLGDAPREDPRAAVAELAAQLGTDPGDGRTINTIAVLFQAHDATAALIGDAVATLARHGWPDGDLDDVLVEANRLHSAVQLTSRLATAEVTVNGHQVAEGATVVLSLAAANRDPAAVADPAAFRPGRATPTWTFGDGRHGCPGRASALAIAAGVVEAIRTRRPPLVAQPSYERLPNLRLPHETTVAWEPGPPNNGFTI